MLFQVFHPEGKKAVKYIRRKAFIKMYRTGSVTTENSHNFFNSICFISLSQKEAGTSVQCSMEWLFLSVKIKIHKTDPYDTFQAEYGLESICASQHLFEHTNWKILRQPQQHSSRWFENVGKYTFRIYLACQPLSQRFRKLVRIHWDNLNSFNESN